MEVETWVTCQPDFHFGMFVGGVVVHDDVQVQFGRGVRIDLAQKGDELGVPVPRLAAADDLATGHVQSGKERGRAVALVVMRVIPFL